MQGRELDLPSARGSQTGARPWGLATDIARFVLGWTFILAGAGLIIEGLAGLLTSTGFVRLSGTTPAFELFVGLMGVTLGGTVVAGMGRLPREGNRNPR